MTIDKIAFYKEKLTEDGFCIIPGILQQAEINGLLQILEVADTNSPSFRKTAELFAVRKFLHEIPSANEVLFTPQLLDLVQQIFGDDFFPVKSIYFDKPCGSNWFVSYHQDLTISVNRKENLPGFGPWTVRQEQFTVQPPLEILENIFTVRIHLDNTDGNNGALRVIPGSHQKGIYRPEHIDWNKEKEVVCEVPSGGVMIMRPLLLHASSRTVNTAGRRVIHLEFSNRELPAPLAWAERIKK